MEFLIENFTLCNHLRMSEPLSKVKILLDSEDSKGGLYFVVLDNDTRRYMSVKISTPEEIIERGTSRNYKNTLKNSFMLCRNDIVDAWNIAKETKKFRKYPASFKDISLIWSRLPQNIIDIYDQIFINYKRLIPKFAEFVSYAPQEENTNENIMEMRAETTEEFNLVTEEIINGTENWILGSHSDDNSNTMINSETGAEITEEFIENLIILDSQYIHPDNNLTTAIDSVETAEEFINGAEDLILESQYIPSFSNYAPIQSSSDPMNPMEIHNFDGFDYNLRDLNNDFETEFYIQSLLNDN
jgi:hypothetical protein